MSAGRLTLPLPFVRRDALNEYEIEIRVKVRFAAEGYREAQARRNRFLQTLGRGEAVLQQRFGVLVAHHAERAKLVQANSVDVQE